MRLPRNARYYVDADHAKIEVKVAHLRDRYHILFLY